MSKNESRRERRQRKEQENSSSNPKRKTQSGLSKVYYWVIGILFLILLLLVVFIFSRSGDKVNLGNEEDTGAIVQDENTEQADPAEPAEEETSDTEATDNAEEENAEEEPVEDEESEEDTEEDTEEEISPGDSTTVNEDAPHDSSHATNFNEGSSDRVAIKNQVMSATGLGSDLTEWWVGNNGPGRVSATVSSSDRSEIYQVNLQYGDGNWHVISYERLSSIPNN